MKAEKPQYVNVARTTLLEKIFDVTIQIGLIYTLVIVVFIITNMAMYIATVGVEEALSMTNKRCIIVETKKE